MKGGVYYFFVSLSRGQVRLSDCVLIAALACCAVSDVRKHRIPNLWIGMGFAAGVLCMCLEPRIEWGTGAPGAVDGMFLRLGWEHTAEAVWPEVRAKAVWAEAVRAAAVRAALRAAGFTARMVLVCGLGFLFFILRMTGAGDIKAMGLIAAFLGMEDGIRAIGAGLCLGAVLALGKMLRQGSIYQRFSYLSAYIRRVIQTRKVEAYYNPQRDGYGPVIPLGACLFAGALLTILWKG